jgi:hypothetical protein
VKIFGPTALDPSAWDACLPPLEAAHPRWRFAPSLAAG